MWILIQNITRSCSGLKIKEEGGTVRGSKEVDAAGSKKWQGKKRKFSRVQATERDTVERLKMFLIILSVLKRFVPKHVK